MLPLNDLMPNGDAQFDHLHYKIQNIDRLGSRVQLHCIQLVFSLLLSHFHYSWFQLGIILAEAQQLLESLRQRNTDQSCNISFRRIFWKFMTEDEVQRLKLLCVFDFFINATDKYQNRLFNFGQRQQISTQYLYFFCSKLFVRKDLVDHPLLYNFIDPHVVGCVLSVQECPIALHILAYFCLLLYSFEDLGIQIFFGRLLEIFFHLNQKRDFPFRQFVVLLHYLELMIFFVMLVQDLDDQVQPDGFVEHVFPLD